MTGPEGSHRCSQRLQLSAGGRKKPPVGRQLFKLWLKLLCCVAVNEDYMKEILHFKWGVYSKTKLKIIEKLVLTLWNVQYFRPEQSCGHKNAFPPPYLGCYYDGLATNHQYIECWDYCYCCCCVTFLPHPRVRFVCLSDLDLFTGPHRLQPKAAAIRRS